jgi:hypothetical protein
LLLQDKPKLDNLEYVLNFEQFSKPKTCANVSDWIMESFSEARLKHKDVNQFSADGALNAIGSIAEYEALSRTTRPNDVQLSVCFAHQNERSGGYASGTITFAEPANKELGDVLVKSHKIQVRLSRSSNRMAIYREVQLRNNCKPMLNPDPANETRWNGTIDETVRANIIMGDVSEALDILLRPGGDDHEMVGNDYSLDELRYTAKDKMILRQFEGASIPAKLFSKFTQDTKETWSYVLFESRLAIALSRSDTFTIQPGMYPQPCVNWTIAMHKLKPPCCHHIIFLIFIQIFRT